MSDTSDFRPLLPDGEYTVGFDFYETNLFFGTSPKLALHFKIIEMGEFHGIRLTRWYSVARLLGKPKIGGGFKVKSQTCAFLVEYFTCFPLAPPIKRPDRVPMNDWGKHGYRVLVSKVMTSSSQRDLPKQIQYSRIERLLGQTDDF